MSKHSSKKTNFNNNSISNNYTLVPENFITHFPFPKEILTLIIQQLNVKGQAKLMETCRFFYIFMTTNNILGFAYLPNRGMSKNERRYSKFKSSLLKHEFPTDKGTQEPSMFVMDQQTNIGALPISKIPMVVMENDSTKVKVFPSARKQVIRLRFNDSDYDRYLLEESVPLQHIHGVIVERFMTAVYREVSIYSPHVQLCRILKADKVLAIEFIEFYRPECEQFGDLKSFNLSNEAFEDIKKALGQTTNLQEISLNFDPYQSQNAVNALDELFRLYNAETFSSILGGLKILTLKFRHNDRSRSKIGLNHSQMSTLENLMMNENSKLRELTLVGFNNLTLKQIEQIFDAAKKSKLYKLKISLSGEFLIDKEPSNVIKIPSKSSRDNFSKHIERLGWGNPKTTTSIEDINQWCPIDDKALEEFEEYIAKIRSVKASSVETKFKDKELMRPINVKIFNKILEFVEATTVNVFYLDVEACLNPKQHRQLAIAIAKNPNIKEFGLKSDHGHKVMQSSIQELKDGHEGEIIEIYRKAFQGKQIKCKFDFHFSYFANMQVEDRYAYKPKLFFTEMYEEKTKNNNNSVASMNVY